MKIAVYNPCIERIGGSIATIMAFADTFMELGHTVHVYTTKEAHKQNIKDIPSTIKHYGCKYLEESNFYFDHRASLPTEVIESYDFIFCRGLYHGCFPVEPKKYILWMIYEGDWRNRHKYKNVLDMWTNSNTTNGRLQNLGHVIPAPHDYTLFRKSFLPEEHRDIDFVNIGRATSFEGKGLEIYSHVIKENNLNALLISSTRNETELLRIENLQIPLAVNIPKDVIADYLGRSKFFLFTSYKESCPLVIYEAMNAGCVPISRAVGAVEEQLAGLGFTFGFDAQIPNAINDALQHVPDRDALKNRGLSYDRKNIKGKIQKRIEYIKELNGTHR